MLPRTPRILLRFVRKELQEGLDLESIEETDYSKSIATRAMSSAREIARIVAELATLADKFVVDDYSLPVAFRWEQP